MNIFVTHSSAFDYQEELYRPLRECRHLQAHDLFLPHEDQKKPVNTLEQIATSDLVLAEVTYPSTGSGIELGWAYTKGVPIVGIHLKGKEPSQSLRFVVKVNKVYEPETLCEVVGELVPA